MTESFLNASEEEKGWICALAASMFKRDAAVLDDCRALVGPQERLHHQHKEYSFFMYPHHGGSIRVAPEGSAWGQVARVMKDPFSQAVTAAFEQLQEPISRTYLLGGKSEESVGWPVFYAVQDRPDLVYEAGENQRSEFEAQAKRWYEDTKYVSSAVEIVLHPSYQRIIGMGPAVLPLILRDLQEQGRDWFWALSSITGENPVRATDAGNVPMMKAAWLDWGRRHGYI